MKFIRNLLDKARPDFEKGGKFEKLEPLFEANETFLFSLPKPTKSGAHVRDGLDTKRLMTVVIVALLPCFVFGMYNVGFQHFQALGVLAEKGVSDIMLYGAIKVMPIVIVSYAAGGIWEVLFSIVRKHEINEGFLVTGLLIPLTLPPTIPLWQVAVGVSFGVVIGKEVFGGTGMNIFNPALTARAFLFFSYAGEMSGDGVWVAGDSGKFVDGFSGATPLAVAANHAVGKAPGSIGGALESFGTGAYEGAYTLKNMAIGLIPGSIGETSAMCCLFGAVVLIITGIASWRIICSGVIATVAFTALLNVLTKDAGAMTALSPQHQLVMGGYAFGLVFMATDPVSASQTKTGKWIYGGLIGVVVVIVRVFNGAFPEGMMLTILFANVFAAMIDHFVVQSHIKRRLRRVAKA